MHVYYSASRASRTVALAFATGAGLPMVRVPEAGVQPGAVALYGQLRGLRQILERAWDEGRPWLYMDNGYFRPGHFNGYFRATLGAYQHAGLGDAAPADYRRWFNLHLKLQPWRASGGHVLVCLQTERWFELHRESRAQWLASVVEQLQRHTDRPIRVREKPEKKDAGASLAGDLEDCWAVVSHTSNAAVDALLAGVPVFTTGACAAASMGLQDLSAIERPFLPDDRERWAAVLAANQWTLEEMRQGLTARALDIHNKRFR